MELFSTGGHVAYKFTTGGVNDDITVWDADDVADYDPKNPFRSKRTTYALPSYNEWYKAAYYNPADSLYYKFANGKNTMPTPVSSGIDPDTAVFSFDEFEVDAPADVHLAGGLSPYGVMGLEGNAWEWEESSFDVSTGNYNTNGSSIRGFRGGDFTSDNISSSLRRWEYPMALDSESLGFRVVRLSAGGEVPEPSMMLIGTLLGFGGIIAKRRIKK
ncbi:MAG: SUMF1/EgtB/PvdO family nonheme iron enzyme [Planctomycetota bacterium]